MRIAGRFRTVASLEDLLLFAGVETSAVVLLLLSRFLPRVQPTSEVFIWLGFFPPWRSEVRNQILPLPLAINPPAYAVPSISLFLLSNHTPHRTKLELLNHDVFCASCG